MNITKHEIRTRLGYILLGFFTFYLVEPVRLWLDANIHLDPLLVGAAGILLTLYIFDF